MSSPADMLRALKVEGVTQWLAKLELPEAIIQKFRENSVSGAGARWGARAGAASVGHACGPRGARVAARLDPTLAPPRAPGARQRASAPLRPCRALAALDEHRALPERSRGPRPALLLASPPPCPQTWPP